jgi:GNAT superfamily N-acetyltransferase
MTGAPAFSLRPSGAGDDAACGELVGAAAGTAPYTSRIAFALDVIADRSPLPIPAGYLRIVAEAHGRIAGLAQFSAEERYLKYLFVRPELQGRGAGGLLLAAVEEAIGLPVRLTALSVNDAGLRFYLRRGYAVVGGVLEEDWHGGPVVWLDLEKRRPGP